MQKHTFKLSLLVVLLLCYVTNINSATGAISFNTYTGSCGQNVNYTLNTISGLLVIEGTGEMYDYTSTSIPWYSYRSSIKNVEIYEGVTSIGSYAFWNCSSLTSVTIPESLISIGNYAFYGCTGLTKAEFASIKSPCSIKFGNKESNPLCYAKNLYVDGTEITKITIPDDVTSINDYAFFGCENLLTIHISNYVKSIGNSAFEKCSNLTKVTIPQGIIYPGTKFPKVLPQNLESIGNDAFAYCSKLTSILIPHSVTSIGSYAFYNCSDLVKAEFNNLESLFSISFGNTSSNPLYYAKNLYLNGKEIKEIILQKSTTSINSHTLEGYNGIIAVPLILKTTVLNAGINIDKLFVYDDFSNNLKSYMKGFKCQEPTPNPNMEFTNIEPYITFTDIKFFLTNGIELPCTKSDDGYLVKGLPIGNTSTIKVTYLDKDNNSQSCEFSVKTNSPKFSITTSTRQSTITVKSVDAESDITCTAKNPGVEYNGKKYDNLPTVIEDLYPGQRVLLYPYAIYDGEIVKGTYKDITTMIPTLTINANTNITASSLELSGSYSKGDAIITDEQITVNGKTYKGNKILATGLNPNTKYTVTYSLKANGHVFTGTRDFTTSALTMKTSQPKVINVGNIIVAAEANVSNEEKNVGFEWRRKDWTSDIASNTGSAIIYNGKMEGYIRNINSNYLWQYRPYYLSDSGKYYYGDWVGVDPTNTSYFEATVHTYDDITIEGNTALVKGYALRGTDNIKVQGFVYWKYAGTRAKGSGDLAKATGIPNDAITIEASGQVMTATLKDLEYGMTYSYMAFATTVEGETFYGEEMTFSTGERDKCFEPSIEYTNGMIKCESKTDNAECIYTYMIKGEGKNSGSPNANKIEITAYATAEGYADSEKVTKTFDYVPAGSGLKGDVNGDGKVTMADANEVMNIYLGK